MSNNIKHVTAYYLDAKDGRPASEAPNRHGPVLPDGLTVDIVDRREHPPLIIGTMPASQPLSAGMQLINQAEHAERVQAVNDWHQANAERQAHERRQGMVLSRFQARAVLRIHGYREQVDQMMQSPDADPLTADAWADASEFKRLSPTILDMMQKLGISDDEADAMFEEGAAIEA